MKTVRLKLSNEALSDRSLQISELCSALNKASYNDFQELNQDEIIEYDESENDAEPIYWSVSHYKETDLGTFEFELDC
jgi:hypothetical protein